MKKYIGFALWLIAFLLPFRYAILDTDEVVLNDGTADNITGMLSFVAFIALVFIGYLLVDSSGSQPAGDGHGH